MGWKTLIMVGSVLAVASTAAVAFQEQRPAQPAPPAQQEPTPPALKLEGDATQAPPRASGGTEVRIPGLGKIGVLPRMDFGLDLLYGAADQQRQATTPSDKPDDNDGLTIRGSVKHKF